MRKYSQERLDAIKEAWEVQGLSALEIVNAFPELLLTRCAVLGLVHRKGFQKKGGPAAGRPMHPAGKPAYAARKQTAEKEEVRSDVVASEPPGAIEPALQPLSVEAFGREVESEVPSLPECVPIHQLEGGQCKWPIGKTEAGEHLFCGKPAGSHKVLKVRQPYCPHHAEKAGAGYKFRGDSA